MKIYVDESGSFAEKKEPGHSWNVVVSYAIPDHSETQLSILLNNARKITKEIEPKTSKFEHVDLLKFINSLKILGGTLFAAIVNTEQKETEFLNKVCAFDSANFSESQLELKNKNQLILQANLFLELLNATFWGAWIRYGKLAPAEIRHAPGWFIDEKCKRYEEFVKKNVKDFLTGEYINYQYTYEKPVKNIVHINKNGIAPSITQNLINRSMIRQMDNQKPDITINPKNAFDTVNFFDSKSVDGIQVAGILAGAIRGCLMGRYDQRTLTIARSLGKLMINPPKGLTITPRNELGKTTKAKDFMPIFEKFSTTSDNIFLNAMRSNANSI